MLAADHRQELLAGPLAVGHFRHPGRGVDPHDVAVPGDVQPGQVLRAQGVPINVVVEDRDRAVRVELRVVLPAPGPDAVPFDLPVVRIDDEDEVERP